MTLRLVPDFHPDAGTEAVVLFAEGVHPSEEALWQLRQFLEDEEFVYVKWEAGYLYVQTEDSEPVVVRAHAVSASATSFNEAEFNKLVSRLYAWYLSENGLARKQRDKLNRICALLVEEARRIELKARGHGSTSTAGVLYAQHLHFIERLLRESEA